MGKNQKSVMVFQIRVKFWWMIPMGVKYNHTKFAQETQRWRPGTGFASGGSSCTVHASNRSQWMLRARCWSWYKPFRHAEIRLPSLIAKLDGEAVPEPHVAKATEVDGC